MEGGLPVCNTGSWTIDALFNELVGVGVAVMTGMNGKSLLNIERDAMGSDLALRVVDFNEAFGNFVRKEHILVEDTGHSRGTLVNAAPSLDVAGLGLCLTDNKIHGLFTDGKNLFVLHIIVLIVAVELDLDEILYLGLGLFTRFFVLESE